MNRLSPDQGTLGERLDDIDGSGLSDEDVERELRGHIEDGMTKLLHATSAVSAEGMRRAEKFAGAILANSVAMHYRKETIKAQRVAANLSARARSYLGALCVYHPSQVPPECRASAAAQQERAAVAYNTARDWAFLMGSAS